MKVGELMVEMGADIARLRAEMTGARKTVSDAASDINGILGKIGLGLSVGGLVAWGKAAVDAGSQAWDMAQKVGMSVEELTGLSTAFKQSGVDAAGMKTGLVQLSKNVVDNEGAFKALGIQVKGAGGEMRPTKDVLLDVADVFQAMPDGILKTKLATELFGKAGADMIPVLNAGSTGLQAMTKDAERLGMVISTEAARAADDFGDSLDAMGQKGQAATLNFLGQTLPVLTEFNKQLLETGANAKLAGGSAEFWSDAFATAAETVAVLFINTAYVFRTVAEEAMALGRQVKAFFTDGVAAAGKIGDEWRARAAGMREEVDKQSEAILNARKRNTELNTALKAGAEAAALNAGETRRLSGYVNQSATAKAEAAIKAKELATQQAKAAAEAQKHAEATAKLVTEIKAEASGLSGDFPRKLAELVDLRKRGLITLDEYIKSVQRLLAQQPLVKSAIDEEAKALSARIKLKQAEGAEEAKRDALIVASLVNANDMVLAIKRETEQLSMSNTEREISNALLALEKAGLVAGTEEYNRYAAAVRAAIVNRDTVSKSVEASTAIADEWKKTTDQIGQGLTDSLFRAFESGKNFFKTLWDGIVNTFKTTVLRLVINAVMSPVNGAIGGLLGGGSTLANAATGGGALGDIGGIGSLLGGIGSIGSGLGALGTLGSGLSAGFGTGLTGLMEGAGLLSGAVGAGSATGALAGAGTMLGAAAPYAAAAGALYAIYNSLKHETTPHTGAALTLGEDGTVTNVGKSWRNIGSNSDIKALLTQTFGGVQQMVSALGAVGSGGKFGVGGGFADDSSKDASWGAFGITRNGQTLSSIDTNGMLDSETFADGKAGIAAYMQAIGTNTAAAIDQLGLPSWAQEIVDALGSSPTLDQLSQATQQIMAEKERLESLKTGETLVAQGEENLVYTAATNTGLEALSADVDDMANRIVNALSVLQGSLEAGLAAATNASQQVAAQLRAWDDGGALVTTPAA